MATEQDTDRSVTASPPSHEEMCVALRPHVEWAEGNARRCADRAVSGTMSYEAAIGAAKTAAALRAALSQLEASRPESDK